MSRHLHLDPVGGIAGDMFLGLLVDLGLDLEFLEALPDRLGLEGIEIQSEPVLRCSLAARKIHVRIRGWEEGPGGQGAGGTPPGTNRRLEQMLAILSRADLAARARELASETITRLFAAEAQVHGQELSEVHLHEAGADDALVDIVGACAGLVELGIESVSCSLPIPVGGGVIHCAHGTLPVPGPAVSVLLEGLETKGGPIQKELVTPTGAALLRSLVGSFGSQPALTLLATGYGAGTRDDESVANVLRGSLGHRQAGGAGREIAVISTTVDDMNPQDVPVLLSRLIEEGALDAWTRAVQMKKGRQGLVITALSLPVNEEQIAGVLLRESPTLGVRLRRERRLELDRRFTTVETPWGPVRVKQAIDGEGRILRAVPEFDDCLEIAQRTGITVDQVRQQARARTLDRREDE